MVNDHRCLTGRETLSVHRDTRDSTNLHYMEALDTSTQDKEARVKKHRQKNEEEKPIEKGGREMDEQQSIGGAWATKR